MGFDALLGNERLKENLSRSLIRGRTSHFYLLTGPEGSGKHTLARLLAEHLLCESGQIPCPGCSACRKVRAGIHPDFITVDDPEKKTVPVDLIRQARADIYVRPNEGRRKIYLFPRGQDMGLPSQNALLKVLEEPPEYGVFLLLTTNPENLLPTVRSRCTELRLLPLAQSQLEAALTKEFPQAEPGTVQAAIARSGGYLGQARQLLLQGEAATPQVTGFVQAFTARDSMALMQVLVPMERWKRDALIPLLNQWLELLQEGLACRSGLPAVSPLARKLGTGRSSAELMNAVTCLKKAIAYTQSNVSPAAVCGYLEWTLR